MFTQLAAPFLSELDSSMRQVVSRIPDDAPGFGLMLRYALGWVDERNQPLNQPGGKRIRPLLLLLCASASGGDWNAALPAAAAVELLHNFSLIHDDIQDNSPTRHGRPTVWKIWGEANAINAGDALFSLAHCSLETVADAVEPTTLLHLWRIFNGTTLELTRGQHLDMHFEQQAMVSIDEYLSMIAGKSAALVAASAEMGALVGSQDEILSGLYAEFGLNLGLAFQIRDDILGIWGNPDVTGKSAATDVLARKKSLPVISGLSQSEELVGLYRREPFTEADAAQAVAVLNRLQVRDATQEYETRYYRRALQALDSAHPRGYAAEQLVQVVTALFERAY